MGENTRGKCVSVFTEKKKGRFPPSLRLEWTSAVFPSRYFHQVSKWSAFSDSCCDVFNILTQLWSYSVDDINYYIGTTCKKISSVKFELFCSHAVRTTSCSHCLETSTTQNNCFFEEILAFQIDLQVEMIAVAINSAVWSLINLHVWTTFENDLLYHGQWTRIVDRKYK